MRIESALLKNFRGFERWEGSFSPHINVLVGENGSGKSAMLDALAVGVGSFFLGVDGVSARVIEMDDVRVLHAKQGDTTSVFQQFPVELSFRGMVVGRELSWMRSLTGRGGKTTHKYAADLKAVVVSHMREVDAGHSEKLPLVAYHGTGRLWTQRHTWKATRSRRHRSRRDGYADCLEAQSDSKTFVEWLERMERIEMQEGKTPLVLRAVRDAICLLVPSCTDLRYRFADNEVVATFEDGRRLPIRMLSDGF